MASSFLLISAGILSLYGIRKDIKERVFPNPIIISIAFIGELYSFVAGGYKLALGTTVLFILLNVIGMFFHKMAIVAPGDMKYFSLIAFFMKWSWQNCLMLCFSLIVVSMLASLILSLKQGKSPKNVISDFKMHLTEVKIFCLSGIRTSKTYKEVDDNDETIPFTIIILVAFIITYLGGMSWF